MGGAGDGVLTRCAGVVSFRGQPQQSSKERFAGAGARAVGLSETPFDHRTKPASEWEYFRWTCV